jgi:hypothetical protein
MATDLVPIVDGETVARVLLHGDLKNLTASQKVSYYRAVCESVGLNPLTQPFQYLVLNGKEILYARREATEQLRHLHAVSITIVGRELLDGIYVVTAHATLPDGRTDENIGAVSLEGLKGEARANGMMKAETKAKRRVTLAICGLGMLDETEVADIPDLQTAPKPQKPRRRDLPEATVEPPKAGAYATTAAPPPPPTSSGDDKPDDKQPAAADDLPAGYVRIARLDSSPTKNPNVIKHFVTFSTGEQVSTINGWLATVAQEYCEKRTPVLPDLRLTKWGTELVALKTADEPPLPLEPIPADADIPF